MKRIIVSRHAAAISFIQASAPEFADAVVLASVAYPDEVVGAAVAGNLPLHLAALAAEVVAVEFTGAAPRGAGPYTLDEMRAAGARLVRYRVQALGVYQSAAAETAVEWSDRQGHRDRAAGLWLRDGAGRLYSFTGAPIPGVAAGIRVGGERRGKWSHTVYRVRLAPGVAVAFRGHSGWETGRWDEALAATTWDEVAAKLLVTVEEARRFFASIDAPRTCAALDAAEAPL